MKAVIVCASDGNTRRVAEAMGQVLAAPVVSPSQYEQADYDLVGFGSGIFYGSFHASLREFVASLPPGPRRKAFVYATSGFPDAGFQRFSRPLVRLLEQKGFEVVDLRKGHPNAGDLEAARTFAASVGGGG